MSTGKTVALTIQTFVSKVMFLLFTMLSRVAKALLPRSKCLLISWLKSPFAVILEPKKIKSATVSIVSPSTCHQVMRPDAVILVSWMVSISSVLFICSVTSDTLWPLEPQHAKPPYPSSTPGIHPNPCSLSRWCHPTILSSGVPFSSCPQSFPASESFPMSQIFASDGQSTGVSALASFLPKKSQGWSPSEWTGWISL